MRCRQATTYRSLASKMERRDHRPSAGKSIFKVGARARRHTGPSTSMRCFAGTSRSFIDWPVATFIYLFIPGPMSCTVCPHVSSMQSIAEAAASSSSPRVLASDCYYRTWYGGDGGGTGPIERRERRHAARTSRAARARGMQRSHGVEPCADRHRGGLESSPRRQLRLMEAGYHGEIDLSSLQKILIQVG